jgi:hypothetical protein
MAGEHALPLAPLSDPQERVRFLLAARIDTDPRSQQEIAGLLRSDFTDPKRFSDWVRHDDLLTDTGMARIRRVDQVLGTNVIASFASRVRSTTSTHDMDILADGRWWPDLRDRRLDSAVAIIVAGHALLAHRYSTTSAARIEPSLGERNARRHLAFGLCRVATGSYGYANDAIALLASLAIELDEPMAYFMRSSPMGGWIARSAERALRLYPDNRELYKRFARTARQMSLDPRDPSRIYFPLLLRRRLVLHSGYFDDDTAAFQFIKDFVAVAFSEAMPARWRRFSLWILVECLHTQTAVRSKSSRAKYRSLLRTAIRNALNVPVLADVSRVMSADGPFGIAADWVLPSGDIYLFETRNDLDGFVWSNDTAIDEWVQAGLSPFDVHGRLPSRWRSLGVRTLPRVRDAVSELIVHPGLVRAQTAIEMLAAAGPVVARNTSELLTDLADKALHGESCLHTNPAARGAIDNVLTSIGKLRGPVGSRASAEWLAEYALEFAHADHRASAIWSLGDTWAGSGFEPTKGVNSMIERAVKDPEAVVRRAALHAIGALNRPELEPSATLAADQDPDPRTRRFARWAAISMDHRTLIHPPADMENGAAPGLLERWG